MFADDVKIIKICKSREDCVELQNDINAVYRWSLQNQLHFNPGKCEFMTFTRMISPLNFQYAVGDVPVARVQQVRDLGVLFDPQLTFRQQVQRVTDAAHRRLGFVLRNAAPLSPAASQVLYAALVRSILESNAVVWSPHEDKYILMLEQIQKKFLRALYKRLFSYYPYLYPTLFIQGCLGYQSLEIRRSMSLAKFVIGILRNKIHTPALVEQFTRLTVPNVQIMRYLRERPLAVMASPASHTVHRAQAPAARARTLLNSVLAAAPQCDLFVSGEACLMTECKRMLEMNARTSTVPT